MKQVISDLAMKRLRNALGKLSPEKERSQWADLKEHLDWLGAYLYVRRPAWWFKKFGIKNPRYVVLLEADWLTCPLGKGPGIPYRQAMALAGLEAARQGDAWGAGRAILLLGFHTNLKSLISKPLNASALRRKLNAEGVRISNDEVVKKYLDHMKKNKPSAIGKTARNVNLSTNQVRNIVKVHPKSAAVYSSKKK